MLEWIDNVWKHIVVEPSVLILDSLRVHKEAVVADALACTGTTVIYELGGSQESANHLTRA